MIAIALKSTVVILIALLLVVAARRARASVRHLILAALFVFLLLLPVVQTFAPSVNIEVEKTVVTKAPLTPSPLPASGERVAAGRVRGWSWSPAPLYFAVSALLLAHLAIRILRLRRLAAASEVWIEGTTRMNELARAENIRRAALVVVSDEVGSPLTFQSTIVMPAAARDWTSAELTHALRHELEHVRRDDWMLQLVARAACALYWMHPLVWVAWRRFCLEAERACDDAVIGSCAPDAYATQLVSLAKNMQRVRAVPALAMASRSRLALRVHAILDRSQRRGPHGRYAAIGAGVALFAFLVAVAPARLIASDGHDDTPALGEALVKAAEAGNVQAVRRLLDAGVDVNTIAEGDGTALIGAARGGQRQMVAFLLERGADPNLAARGDGSPLIAAARNGFAEVVAQLLDAGADIDRQVDGDENALMRAAWNGHVEVVRLLLARGANVNVRAYEQGELRTPLRLARRGGHEDVVRLLLAAGARE